jgi:uncharacterized protein (TIGR02217 family)
MATTDIFHSLSVSASMGNALNGLNAWELAVEAMLYGSAANLHSISAEVLMRADMDPITGGILLTDTAPNAEDSDMVYTDIIFPRCLSYGSTGNPHYETEKVEVASGMEARQSRWRYPKHEYNINMENLEAPDVAEIMRIWHVCSGDAMAFLFMDPLDNTSADTDDGMSLKDVSATDQFVASAVGTVSAYPLYKSYKQSSRTKTRRIKYPMEGTLIVAVDGFTVTNWNYNYTSCMLNFTKATGDITADLALTGNTLSCQPGALAFASLNVNDLFYMTGFTLHASNNVEPGAMPLRVVSTTDTTLVFEKYDQTAWTVADELEQPITLTQTLPPTGAAITAGFYFYVPVRFSDGDNATSEIKAGLRDSVQADFTNITLKEVFD